MGDDSGFYPEASMLGLACNDGIVAFCSRMKILSEHSPVVAGNNGSKGAPEFSRLVNSSLACRPSRPHQRFEPGCVKFAISCAREIEEAAC